MKSYWDEFKEYYANNYRLQNAVVIANICINPVAFKNVLYSCIMDIVNTPSYPKPQVIIITYVII